MQQLVILLLSSPSIPFETLELYVGVTHAIDLVLINQVTLLADIELLQVGQRFGHLALALEEHHTLGDARQILFGQQLRHLCVVGLAWMQTHEIGTQLLEGGFGRRDIILINAGVTVQIARLVVFFKMFFFSKVAVEKRERERTFRSVKFKRGMCSQNALQKNARIIFSNFEKKS